MTHKIHKYMQRFFFSYLIDIKGLSTNTALAYRDALKLFFCFLADRIHKHVDQLLVEDISDKFVLSFLNHLEVDRGNCIRTRNARLAAIRSFMVFIAREEPALIELSARIRTIPIKRTTHKIIEGLDDQEVRAILNAVDLRSPTGLRDRALILFLYNTGARVQEAVDLRREDLRLTEMGQVKLLGKGRKQRACPLWPETVQAIKNYIQDLTPNSEACLFLNTRGQPITRFGVRYMVKKYKKLAEKNCPILVNKSISPHSFRHATAMMLIRAGNDITMVKDWLGHADINTTNLYFELDMDMKRKVLEKANPPVSPGKGVSRARWKRPRTLAFLEGLGKGGFNAPRAPS